MNFKQQAETMLTQAANRRRNPISVSTAVTYRSVLNRVFPVIGNLSLERVQNGTLKGLLDQLSAERLSAATINMADTLVKAVVASAVDENGNQLHPRTWNNDFTELPQVVKVNQKAPAIDSEGVSGAISKAFGPDQALYALLAGSGLRIGEAAVLGIREGVNIWDPETGTVTVRGTLSRGKVKLSPKTLAGNRVIDLDPKLNTFLKIKLGTQAGQPFHFDEKTLRSRLEKAGVRGGFHAFRRFRVTHLRKARAPEGLIQYWDGHARKSMTDLYDKIAADVQARKEWAVKAGLGFRLEVS